MTSGTLRASSHLRVVDGSRAHTNASIADTSATTTAPDLSVSDCTRSNVAKNMRAGCVDDCVPQRTTMTRMSMGTRENEQPPLWVAASDLPASPGHPFYTRLNAILDAEDFDRFVEDQCRRFYAPVMGRPSLAPGRYFRLLLIGYFEGIDAERGIAWRAADSLAVRTFLRLG